MEAIVYFFYFISASISIIGISQIGLMLKLGRAVNRPLFVSLSAMLICTAFIDLLYMFYAYNYIRYGVYYSSFVLRVFDFVLFVLLKAFWIWYVILKANLEHSGYRRLSAAVRVYTAFTIAAGIYEYGFLMGGYYQPVSAAAERSLIVIQTGIFIVGALLILYILMKCLGTNYLSGSRRIILFVSILLCLNELFNTGIILGPINGINTRQLELYDLTPFFLFIINCVAVYLLYTEDFSGLYFESNEIIFKPKNVLLKEEHTETEDNTGEAEDRISSEELLIRRVGHIASIHMLTVREREVLILCYKGRTNPEIADELCISINTVKRHMHNIFEKLDVTSRIEIIHMVNNCNSES